MPGLRLAALRTAAVARRLDVRVWVHAVARFAVGVKTLWTCTDPTRASGRQHRGDGRSRRAGRAGSFRQRPCGRDCGHPAAHPGQQAVPDHSAALAPPRRAVIRPAAFRLEAVRSKHVRLRWVRGLSGRGRRGGGSAPRGGSCPLSREPAARLEDARWWGAFAPTGHLSGRDRRVGDLARRAPVGVPQRRAAAPSAAPTTPTIAWPIPMAVVVTPR